MGRLASPKPTKTHKLHSRNYKGVVEDDCDGQGVDAGDKVYELNKNKQ